jgi:hypothetical protein
VTYRSEKVLGVIGFFEGGRYTEGFLGRCAGNMASNLHLVDDQGRPLPKHIVDAVKRLEPAIARKFSSLCDPAELSNSMEERARQMAVREKKRGPLPDADSLRKFAWRSLFNGALSLIRKRKLRREQCLSTEELCNLTEVACEATAETILACIDGKRILSELSPRDRQICDLEIQDLDDAEIAAYLNISRDAVRQARHRRKAKVASIQAKRKSGE